jgi:DNA-binding NarL/FixJ family response regulator
MIEIIVLDDNPLTKKGLNTFLLDKTKDIKVTDDAVCASELMKKLSGKKEPDLLILDISMPDRNGVEVLKDLKSIYPNLPVLMFSGDREDPQVAVRALMAGASGYLDKKDILENLEHAIRTIVQQKKRYVSLEVAQELANYIDNTQEGPLHGKLTNREYQVFCLVASGKKVSNIAEALSLSVQTVHTYLRRLKDKMNMESNAELTRYALNENLID